MTHSLTREAADVASNRLKVFAQPQRLMILAALVDRELSVGTIEAGIGVGQPALSQQLAELRRAGLVTQRRVAKQVLYRLADERTTSIVRMIGAMFGAEGDPAEPIAQIIAPSLVTRPLRSEAAMFAVMKRA